MFTDCVNSQADSVGEQTAEMFLLGESEYVCARTDHQVHHKPQSEICSVVSLDEKVFPHLGWQSKQD